MKRLIYLLLCLIAGIGMASAQTTKVTGIVISADDNEPIIGASIVVKGTTIGTVTDIDGAFTLDVPSATKTLSISYVGMETQEVAVKPSMNIILKSDTELLDEVVVVAYGTAKKESFTGSAELIKSEQIAARTVANVSKALEGTVAGLQTTSGGGQPGEGAKLIIRGFGSINANNDPLYVLDGVPYDGDINAINPNDIETMSVLKDASASALYGARGANGVVMITTKKGKEGKPSINLKASWGVTSRAFPVYDRVNQAQFMELSYEALKNVYLYDQGMSEEAAAKAALENYMNELGGEKYNPYTINSMQLIDPATGKINPDAKLKYADDWFKEGENKTPIRQEYQFSVSGGRDKTNYMFSLGYLNEDGISKNTGFDRYSARLSVDSQLKNWLKSGLSASFSSTKQQYMQEGGSGYYNIWYSSMRIAPIYPVYQRDENGSFVHDANGNKEYEYGLSRPVFNNMNWIAALEEDKRERTTDNLSARTFIAIGDKDNESLGFFKDFTLTVNLGADYRNMGNLVYQNPNNGNASSVGGSAFRENSRMLSYTFNQLLNYNRTFGKHTLDVLLGHEFYGYENQFLEAERQGFPLGGIYDLASAATITGGSSYKNEYRIESVLSRVNYSYDDKYYLSGSFRTDGSSRFFKDSRWGKFWSVGGAWRMTQEGFMEDTKSWLENLTVKASFGSQGNDNILRDEKADYYAWQGLYDMTFANFNMAGGLLMSMDNKNLKWEKNNNLNFGVEAKMFNSRLNVSAEYYIKNTSDLLLFRPKATSTGFNGYYDNVGNMRNNGVDITLAGDVIRATDFTWNMSLLVSKFKNKITKLNDKQPQIVMGNRMILKIGEPINSFYMPEAAGVNPETGNMQFYIPGENGERALTEDYQEANSKGREILGSRIPTVSGSFGNNLQYKDFDFSVLCTYSIGGKIYDSIYGSLMDRRDMGNSWHTDMLDRWQKPGDMTDVPIMKTGINTQHASNYLLSASYFSIKNISLGYNLPKSLLKKCDINTVRFFVTGDNLLLISAKKGMDPQFNFTGTQDYKYSPTRTVSLGIDVKF